MRIKERFKNIYEFLSSTSTFENNTKKGEHDSNINANNFDRNSVDFWTIYFPNVSKLGILEFSPQNFMETESSNRNILCISYFPDLLHPFAVKIFVEIFMWKAQCKIQQSVFHQTRCNKALSIYCVRVEK